MISPQMVSRFLWTLVYHHMNQRVLAQALHGTYQRPIFQLMGAWVPILLFLILLSILIRTICGQGICNGLLFILE